MMRVLGFLTGAALVIGAMVRVLGIPELHDQETLAPLEVTAERLELPAAVDAIVVPAAPVAAMPVSNAPAEPVAEALAPAAPAKPVAAVRPTDAPAAAVADIDTPAEPVAAELPPEVLQGPEWAADERLEVAKAPPMSVEPASPASGLAGADLPLAATPAAAGPAAPAHDARWQSIWNPFRSQIAANGFAARLAAVTDIDYRVVRVKPGTYQVAFAYTNDSERATKIAQIQGATGLDMPEAVP